ncbi:hypothetical protein TNCV_546301 [Trichonephila clavipes]|nr:hypothetical protein TNCV_546301 [Trichonephila clavipes]
MSLFDLFQHVIDLSSMGHWTPLTQNYFWRPSVSFTPFSMSLHLFSMSLDPRVKTIFVSFISFDLSSMSLTCPICHWTCQHVIRPVQHVIGPPVNTIFWETSVSFLPGFSMSLGPV